MKNVTIALDDEIYRQARIRAAERGTSLSALVKAHLIDIAGEGAWPEPPAREPTVGKLREMPRSFTMDTATIAPPAAGETGPEGQPYFVNGKWTFTKDGKPRKPGAMRHLIGLADMDDADWPEGFIDAMYGEETEAAENWWKPYAEPPAKRTP